MANISLFRTERADWLFIIPATVVWTSSLLVALWDFVIVQEMRYHATAISAIGLALFMTGVTIRAVGGMTLGRYYSYVLRTLRDHDSKRKLFKADRVVICHHFTSYSSYSLPKLLYAAFVLDSHYDTQRAFVSSDAP
jgi:hypothetical protein